MLHRPPTSVPYPLSPISLSCHAYTWTHADRELSPTVVRAGVDHHPLRAGGAAVDLARCPGLVPRRRTESCLKTVRVASGRHAGRSLDAGSGRAPEGVPVEGGGTGRGRREGVCRVSCADFLLPHTGAGAALEGVGCHCSCSCHCCWRIMNAIAQCCLIN